MSKELRVVCSCPAPREEGPSSSLKKKTINNIKCLESQAISAPENGYNWPYLHTTQMTMKESFVKLSAQSC